MAEDDAQPDEGQGGSDAPYAEYLNQVPEELREQVEPAFKAWDGNVTKKFQEASEFRQQWEPLAETGIKDLSPDEVSWLVQFRQAQTENPQAVVEWAQEFAQQNGLSQEQQLALEENPEIQQLVEQRLQQHLTPLQAEIAQMNEWRQQQEQQAAYQHGQQMVDQQVEALKVKHGDELPRDAKGNLDLKLLETLAMPFVESDPENAIAKGFAEYQRIFTDAQKRQFEEKARIGQMPAAESGGQADTSPKPVNTLKEAAALATERIRAAQQQ